MTVMMSKSSHDAHEKIWKMIRGLIEFTYDEVAMLTETPYSTVSRYLLSLYSAGYIRPAGKRKEADGRKKVVWRLAKNTGPKAPVPCKCLYDPNIDGLASGSVIPRLDRGIQKVQKPDRPIKSDDDKKKKEPRHVD